MAFITESGTVTSFAEFQDVVNKDQRLFDSNEGLSDDLVEQQLVRATERILTKLRSSAWWKSYYVVRTTTAITTTADIPALDVNRIIARATDFKIAQGTSGGHCESTIAVQVAAGDVACGTYHATC